MEDLKKELIEKIESLEDDRELQPPAYYVGYGTAITDVVELIKKFNIMRGVGRSKPNNTKPFSEVVEDINKNTKMINELIEKSKRMSDLTQTIEDRTLS